MKREELEREVFSGEFAKINLRIPKEQHKLVVGLKGKTIRDITRNTGTVTEPGSIRCILSYTMKNIFFVDAQIGVKIKVPQPDEDDDVIVILGNPGDVDRAAKKITSITMSQRTGRPGPNLYKQLHRTATNLARNKAKSINNNGVSNNNNGNANTSNNNESNAPRRRPDGQTPPRRNADEERENFATLGHFIKSKRYECSAHS